MDKDFNETPLLVLGKGLVVVEDFRDGLNDRDRCSELVLSGGSKG